MKVETRSIEYIPAEERHGKARDLFPIWFGANMHITTLVTGALPIALGLSFAEYQVEGLEQNGKP